MRIGLGIGVTNTAPASGFGPELVLDATFQNQASWVDQGINSGTVTPSGMDLVREIGGGESIARSAGADVSLDMGKTYRVEMNVTAINSGTPAMFVGATNILQTSSTGIASVDYSPGSNISGPFFLRLRGVAPTVSAYEVTLEYVTIREIL